MKTDGTGGQDTTRYAAMLPAQSFGTGSPLMTMYKGGQRVQRNIYLPAHQTWDSAPPRHKQSCKNVWGKCAHTKINVANHLSSFQNLKDNERYRKVAETDSEYMQALV